MAKRLSYEDALRTLGENDSEVLDLAEKLADGGLGLVGVPDLFGVRGALVSKGRNALEGMRDKLKGQSRQSRTEKIEAAYRILTITSFFEAVEEAFEEVGTPFGLDELEITTEEQYMLLSKHVITGSGPGPSYPITHSGRRRGPSLAPLESGRMALAFSRFICGLAVAERHRVTVDSPVMKKFRSSVERRMSARLHEGVLRLGAQIPEFGMWLHTAEHARTRQEIGTGLSDLHEQLSRISSHRPVSRRRQELSASYQAVLDRPILRSDDAPAGLALPSLREAYIPPRGRITLAREGIAPASDAWWRDFPIQDDLQSLVASLITHPRTTESPMVLLGHPGAGKSKFTEMLAAQLPSEDFLPIRVELRTVSPNSPLHVQIEEGLRADLHTSVSWRDLADDADGSLPVIILDGFDELLQATGVDRSDYLERVQEFQQRQEALGQPVVVIVTSRTLVADRTRFPSRTTVIRLEPFDDAQIEQMLGVWNKANEGAFTTKGLLPLEPEDLLRYRDLAEQPLLLLMLLIYDAHDNALRRASQTLSHGELYERLLRMFAKREVDKHRSRLGNKARGQAVEDELRRLEVAAMAMFARGRQSVRADELDQDLAVLMPEAAERPQEADLHGMIAPAHQVLGRFFFVHEARAKTTDGDDSAFEFLHATFGEYLVARMVVATLEELAEDRSRATRRRSRVVRLDDGELHALSSFAVYAGRDKVVSFLEELLGRRLVEDPDLRGDLRDLLIELFREAPFPAPNRSFTEYEPKRLPVATREACYTANLVTLMILIAEEPIPLPELFPEAAGTWHAWRRVVSLWRALPASQWFGILDTVRVRHLGFWGKEGSLTVLDRESSAPINVGECTGFELRGDTDTTPALTNPYEIEIPAGTVAHRLLRSMAMRANGTASRLALILSPYLKHVSSELGTWYVDSGGDEEVAWVVAHDVLRLRLETLDGLSSKQVDERLACYRRLLGRELDGVTLVTLRQALEDLRSWPEPKHGEQRQALARMTQNALRGNETPSVETVEVKEPLRRLRGEVFQFLNQDAEEDGFNAQKPDRPTPFRYPPLPEIRGGSADF
ncbi:NACHT domain-containing protein [Nocardiopsis alkaliphila]|uniref:NACHT domain-containing protein n=1 Tax=Nocardiopsis alkaliphila TaxID=225762 RepID=UPI000345E2C1|nr:ATP-binding protein [Nocardiopsis alkaliphila]